MYRIREWLKEHIDYDDLNMNNHVGVLDVLSQDMSLINYGMFMLNENCTIGYPNILDEMELMIEDDDEESYMKLLVNNFSTSPSILKNNKRDTRKHIKRILENIKYKKKDFLRIMLENVIWSQLSDNKNAVRLLEENKDKIDWSTIIYNEEAIDLIEENLDKILVDEELELYDVCDNKNTVRIMEANIEKLTESEWKSLSSNPKAINLLKKNMDKINWESMSRNPAGYELIKEKLNLEIINKRTHVDVLQIRLSNDMISVEQMCANENPKVLELIDMSGEISLARLCMNRNGLKYIKDKLDLLDDECWTKLSGNENPEVLDILKKHPEKINSEYLSWNPIIFEYDYEWMKENRDSLNKDFIEWVYKPDNMCKWKDWRL